MSEPEETEARSMSAGDGVVQSSLTACSLRTGMMLGLG